MYAGHHDVDLVDGLWSYWTQECLFVRHNRHPCLDYRSLECNSKMFNFSWAFL